MANTVATTDFQNLTLDRVVDPNFDFQGAFWRSIKVFLISYAGYDSLSPDWYQRKFDEYFDAMKVLYQCPNPDMNQLTFIRFDIQYHELTAILGVTKIRRQSLTMARNIRVIMQMESNVNDIRLQMDSETQTLIFKVKSDYTEFVQHRTQNTRIIYRVNADDWVDSKSQLNEFSIGYQEIPAEGFENWFDFGRGIHILIKIVIIVSNEPQPNPLRTSKFHLHTIYLTLLKRYDNYQTLRSQIDKLHKISANKSKVSYIRKRVDPNSEAAYWVTGTSLEDVLQRIRQQIIEKGSDNYSQIGQILSKAVKFADFQISLRFEDVYTDTVCLCSEWCNWNAFFHFNPIYRTLLVNHNQLYLTDKTNVADMYLFCASLVLATAENQTQPNQPPPKTPVFQLLKQANSYKKQNYQRYALKSRSWRKSYQDSQPPIEYITGMAYKNLRDITIVSDVIMQSATDPFDDICCENLSIYYNVLYDLHSTISQIHSFIPSTYIRKWFKEYDRMSREDYCIYIVMSYETRVTRQMSGIDFLFSEDYEYSSIFIRSDEEKQIKQIRDRVFTFAEPQNPLNMKFTLDPLLATFASAYKFLMKVDPTLPSAQSSKALEDMFMLYKEFDTNFNDYLVANSFAFQSDLEQFGAQPQQRLVYQNHYLFYTLKIYLMAFGIQCQCISSMIKWNEYTNSVYTDQVCKTFNFIWMFSTLETKYRNLYANQVVYELPHNIATSVQEFYINYWGLADHEVDPTNSSFGDCIDSGYFQYQRLFFWWTNGGDDRRKFKRILEVFNENLEYLTNRSSQILVNHIMESINSVDNYDYSLETFDVLVYYLVKANCSMTFNIVSQLFKPLHDLQIQELIDTDTSYTLSKPGWVPLFRTMHRVFEHLDQMKQYFAVFDDENERIFSAITKTRTLIKRIYCQFYVKLLDQWDAEMVEIYPMDPPYQKATFLLPLHMASGLAFLSAFIDDFRYWSFVSRKSCLELINRNPRPRLNQQVALHASGRGYHRYLQDHNAISEARPFLAAMWTNIFGPLLNRFAQNTAQILRIDLNQADVV